MKKFIDYIFPFLKNQEDIEPEQHHLPLTREVIRKLRKPLHIPKNVNAKEYLIQNRGIKLKRGGGSLKITGDLRDLILDHVQEPGIVKIICDYVGDDENYIHYVCEICQRINIENNTMFVNNGHNMISFECLEKCN